MKRTVLSFLILLLSSVYGYTESTTEAEYLKTDHFIIRYNPEETPYAVYIAGLAESHYRRIEAFLNYTVRDNVNISVSGYESIPDLSLFSEAIKVSSVSEIPVEEINLYKRLFTIFLRSMSRESSGFMFPGFMDEAVDEPLCSYSLKGFDAETELILRSVFQRGDKNRIIVTGIKNIKSKTDYAVYSGFFYFIESAYGKKALAAAVKNRGYYGGFLKALYAITGKTADTINNEFNGFLSEKYNARDVKTIKPEMITPAGDYIISDFAVSHGGKTIVILKKSNGRFTIEQIDLNTGNSSEVIKAAADMDICSLSFKGSGELLLAGNTKDGAVFLIYSIDTFLKIGEYKIPGVFINSISLKSDNETFLINAFCGISPVVLSMDFNSNVIKREYAGGLLNKSDIIYLGGKIYFSSAGNHNELIEADKTANIEQPVIRFKDDVSSLTLSGELIVVSSNSTAAGNIYTFNTGTGDLREEASFDSPVYKAVISNSVIYCLTYYNGSYGIALKPLSR